MSSDELTMEKDYEQLANEIQQTIDRHNNTFKLIKSTQYSDTNSYESAFKDYKLNKEVEDVEIQRKEIWEILTKKYNENTKMRNYFYQEMGNLDLQLMKQESAIDELLGNFQKLKQNNDTLATDLKNGKYGMQKNDYYMFMYKVLLFVQLVSTLLLIVSVMGLIKKNTCLIIVFILFIATVIFMLYYIYIANLDRNKFSWTKYDLNDDSISSGGRKQCNSNLNRPKKKTDREQLIDERVNSIVNDEKKSKSCSSV
jgi:hypothetical protein